MKKSYCFLVSTSRLSFFACAVFAVTASAGTYWVATNGVDAAGRGSEAEPFETIQYAIDSAEADSTIWVKPGVYDKGGALNTASGATHTNRVVLGKLIHLKSTEGASVTHIVGAADPTTGGVGPAAVRCMVSTNENSKGSTITGFTLRNGYGDDGSSGHNHRAGGFLQLNGNRWIYFQDCTISNCVSFSHGGARGGTFVRCFFANNRVTSSHGTDYPSCAGNANLVFCIVVGNGTDDEREITIGPYSTLVNCTVICNRGYGAYSGDGLYNTIVCGNTKSDYNGSSAINCVLGGYSVVSPLSGDWRIVSGGAADGNGTPSAYSAGVSKMVSETQVDVETISGMAGKDFAGNVIDTSAESLHVGAVQATAPVSGGILWLYGPLSCNGVYVADDVPTYAQSTNGLSQWRVGFARSKVSGSSTNYFNRISRRSPVGDATLVPDLNDSLVMMAPPKTGVVTTNTPIYNKALWVSPSGSDTDNNGSEAYPYATIQKAVDVGGSRTVVFLAPGLYCEGGLSGGECISRTLWIKSRMGF